VVGVKSLNFSADIAVAEIEKEEAVKKGEVYQEREKKSNSFLLALTVILALGFGILLFFFIPLFLSNMLNIKEHALAFNLVAGCIRVIFFLAYVWGISLIGDFRRVFAYHGAEHKSIFAFESGAQLVPENVVRYSRRHPRCGTSFILIVAIFAILVYSVSDTIFAVVAGYPPPLLTRFAIHFSLLPIVAGGSYELLKLSGRTRESRITKILISPGLWLQNITTREPSYDQLEVAIVALETVMDIKDSNLAVRRVPV